ncbi:MAG: hypothetical protein DMG15_04135 [Acidobacteria bacterium]|nr:MAG: hypothetical protein DMG16_28740 [Acidobacteriota bacterium]PYS15813.1 MAG: hypothetical protein DMG15_04135 [Acidobacteriota bacterium]
MKAEKARIPITGILLNCGVNTAASGLTRMKNGRKLAARPIIRIVTQNSSPPFPSRKGNEYELDFWA